MIKDKLKDYYDVYWPKIQAKINEIATQVRSKLAQPSSIIGLDIGTTSVKLAQMVNLENRLTLTKVACVDIGAKEEKDKEQAILAALKKALSGIDTKGAKIICVINCPKTCARKLIVPPMPKQELAEAVRWEVKDYIPFSLDEAILDFAILGEVIDKGVKKLSVGVAASPKETIDKLLSLFTTLQMDVAAIIPMPLALQNLVAKSKLKPDETIAIVNMGATVSELTIYKNSHLEFSRKLPVAGADITKGMTGALVSAQGRVELTIEEAEKIKQEWGLPTQDKAEMIEGKISTTQILSLVRPKVEQLANEIERSFDFYREGMQGSRVDRIILFGGGAQLKGLVEFLGDELGIEVRIGNPLEEISPVRNEISNRVKELFDTKVDTAVVRKCGAHRLSLAIGAALTETGGINLLPLELKEKTKRLVEKVSLKAIATFVIMLLLLFYIGMRIQFTAYEKKLKAAKIEYRTLSSQLQELRKKVSIIQILSNEPYWEDVLKEVNNTLPDNIYLTNLSMKNGIINLKGVMIEGGQTAGGILSNFMLSLEEGLFKNVSLVTMRKRGEDLTTSEFEIKCEID